MTTFNPLDHLDASLQDFELNGPIGSSPPPPPFGYPSHRSGFRSSDADDVESASEPADSMLSAGGYSPPAWRRLGNGDRSSGFWRRTDDLLGAMPTPRSRESSPEYDSADEGDEDVVLARAIRTRLPTGSLSPEKEWASPEPEDRTFGMQNTTLRLDDFASKTKSPSALLTPRETPVADNCKPPLAAAAEIEPGQGRNRSETDKGTM